MDAAALRSFENGEFRVAEIVQEEILKGSQDLLGEDHPFVIDIMHNLAATLWALQQHDEAFKLQREVVRKHQEVSGPYHPATLVASRALAQMRESDSLAMREDMIKERQTPTTFSSILQFLDSSLWYQPQNIVKVLVFQQVSVSARQELLGHDHKKTIQAMEPLVVTMAQDGDLTEAIRVQREIVDLRGGAVASDGADELSPTEVLAFLLREDGKLADAVSLRREVLQRSQTENGLDHAATLAAMSKLALALCETGSVDGAVSTQRTVWEKTLELDGDKHEKTVDALEDLASMLYRQRKPDAAISHQEKVVSCRCHHMGLDDDKTVASSNTLAFWRFEWGEFDVAVSESQSTAKKFIH